MVRKGMFLVVATLLLLMAAGCGGKGREEMLLDRAKVDFADPGRGTFQEMLKEKYSVNLMHVDMLDRVYNSCQVGECFVFDHLRFPLGGPEYWAIQLEFTGKDIITEENVQGTAMMLYVNVVVDEGTRDDFLAWVMTGTTPDQVGTIEKNTRDMFTRLKRML